jgi:hypothetical protein
MSQKGAETVDFVARYARVGRSYGTSAYVYIGVFVVTGVATLGSLDWHSSEDRFLYAAISGACIGVASFLYAGFTVAWLARDLSTRLEALENSVRALERAVMAPDQGND